MVYFCLFFASAVLFYIAQKIINKSRILFYCISYFSIILLSVLAGCRDLSIGTDVLVYGDSVFSAARFSESFGQGLELVSYSSEEVFYIINYISSYFSDNLSLSLFLVMLLQQLFCFHGCVFFKEKVPIWIVMLMFNLVFYNLSLNLMRQCLAVSFLFLSFEFFLNKSFWKLITCVIFSFYFHKTAFVSGCILLLFYYLTSFDEKYQKQNVLIVAVLGAICVPLFGQILELLTNAIDVFAKYKAYGGSYKAFAPGVSTIDVFVRCIVVLCTLFFYRKTEDVEYRYKNFLLMLLVADVSSLILGVYAHFTTRFSYYFLIFEIPVFFAILNSQYITVYTRKILNVSFISLFLFRWWYLNIYFGNNATYPYTSLILDIK